MSPFRDDRSDEPADRAERDTPRPTSWPTPWLAIAAHLSGTPTAQEQASVRAWQDGDPSHAETIETLVRVVDQVRRDRTHHLDARWTQLLVAIRHAEGTLEPTVPRGRPATDGADDLFIVPHRTTSGPGGIAPRPSPLARSRPSPHAPLLASRASRFVVGIATLAVLLLCAGIGLEQLGGIHGLLHRSTTEPAREIVTRAGERATISLADGSQIMLGPSSRLTILPGFGDGRRDLALQGMGYFTVAHADRAPFTVTNGRTRVRVLGTVFGIRHYAGDRYTTVAVRSGRVAVADTAVHQGTTQLIAMANDVARVDSSGVTLLRGEQNVASLLQWADGRLVFKNARVGTVLPELARWYDVSFEVTDPKINDLLLTAAFDNGSIEDLPHVLSIVLNVGATRSGRTITLAPW